MLTAWMSRPLAAGDAGVWSELARGVATAHHRPAWLPDESGYPLKPIRRSGFWDGATAASRF